MTPESSSFTVTDVVQRKPATTVAILLTGLLSAGLLGYTLGSDGSGVRHTIGIAHVGSGMASIEADGVFYGLDASVVWIDQHGSSHEAGWPECLTPGSTVTVSFGAHWVDLADDNGESARVAYVDCRQVE